MSKKPKTTRNLKNDRISRRTVAAIRRRAAKGHRTYAICEALGLSYSIVYGVLSNRYYSPEHKQAVRQAREDSYEVKIAFRGIKVGVGKDAVYGLPYNFECRKFNGKWVARLKTDNGRPLLEAHRDHPSHALRALNKMMDNVATIRERPMR